MRFSLILGTVGRTDELDACLGSLRAQTLGDFELIVVDQNPDDRLASVLAPYEGSFPILHLRPEERGLSRAKNLGLSRASGEIVGFPDDNCRYPPDLLERVDRFLAGHPGVAGVCGRSVDEEGKDSNLRFDVRRGPIDRFNVWRRAMAYSIFLRAPAARSTRFDEELGPGAGTPWWAADEIDYLLRVLGRGASLLYNPDLVAIHPQPISGYDRAAMRRAYHYGCGMGHVLRKHRYPLPFVAKMLFHPLKNAALALTEREPPRAKYLWSTFQGRLAGLLPRAPGRSAGTRRTGVS